MLVLSVLPILVLEFRLPRGEWRRYFRLVAVVVAVILVMMMLVQQQVPPMPIAVLREAAVMMEDNNVPWALEDGSKMLLITLVRR